MYMTCICVVHIHVCRAQITQPQTLFFSQQFPRRLFFPTPTTRSTTLHIWKTFVAIPTTKSSTMIPTTAPLRSIHAVVHHLQPTCDHCYNSHHYGTWMPTLRQPKIFGGRSTWWWRPCCLPINDPNKWWQSIRWNVLFSRIQSFESRNLAWQCQEHTCREKWFDWLFHRVLGW